MNLLAGRGVSVLGITSIGVHAVFAIAFTVVALRRFSREEF